MDSPLQTAAPPPDDEDCTELALSIHDRSVQEWGSQRATVLVGRHPLLMDALAKVVRFAASESPVLVTGETGTGKELFARALYLSSPRARRGFLSVNCAQYTGNELIASALFGHRKGSFTGAVTDHRGVFEEGDGGVVFLDEVGELPLAAQSMLLRVLSEGEIVPVGGSRPKRLNVRIVAATSRDLRPMIDAGRFRADLYYRLRYLHVEVPPLRQRGDDWERIARHYLNELGRQGRVRKTLAGDTVRRLRHHPWPGNVREVRSFVDTGYHMSAGTVITLADLGEALESQAAEQHDRQRAGAAAVEYCAAMAGGEETFWELIHRPFMERDLNRGEVRDVVARGLDAAHGSYKRLLDVFGISQADYLKFMDFLRHHRLKPDR